MRRKKEEGNGPKKEIIRRQYFRVFLLVLAAVFLTVGIMTLTYSLAHGTFDGSQWAQGMLDSAKVTGVLAIPLVLLAVLNRFVFGKVVCTLDEEGLHCSEGCIFWEEIVRIEYEVIFPAKYEPRWSYARIIRKDGETRLPHAPLVLLSRVKRYRPELPAFVSRDSKWELTGFVVLMLGICVLLSVL